MSSLKSSSQKKNQGNVRKTALGHILRSVIAAVDGKPNRKRRGRHRPSEIESESTGESDACEVENDGEEELDVPDPPPCDVEEDGPNKIFGFTHDALDMADVLKWLVHAEENDAYADKMMTEPPVKPKAGQLLMYQCKRHGDHDHHRDQYFGFQMTGSTRGKRKQPVLKKYFKMTDRDGNNVNFQKATYERKSSSDNLNKVVLIHYLGDHSVYQGRPHGHSRTEKIFTATTKTNLENIRKEVQETGKGNQAVYEKLIKQAAEREDFSEREAVVAPRDRKQVENVKHDVEVKKRLLRCEIFSAIEMGRNQTLGQFILRHVVNPYDLIIMAEPTALRFASNLLMAASRDPELPQYLCYDTTFNLADAFVSVLVIRNTYVIGDPIMPVIYLIHERKLEAVHTEFFRELADKIDLQELTQSVPIVFDRERAISNAVRRIIPEVKIVYCSNHILRDVKYWVRKAGGKQDDLKVLKGHIRCMLNCETTEEFDEYYSNVSPMWSQGFKEYFENELLDDIKNRAAKLYTKQFAAFQGKNATNNASETFNFMIKNRTEWRELRVDSLIMALFNLQLSMLHEFERAFKPSGVGRYVLKPQYKNFTSPLDTPAYMTWTESKFLETFKEGVYNPKSNIEKEGNYMQSRSSLAKLTCERNLVSLDSRAGVFVVTGVYNGKRVVVERKDSGVLECTCKSTGYCYHKLSVLYSLKMDISEDQDSYSLSILRRKARGGKKTGRKAPTVDDYISNVDPAPDSDLAKHRDRSQCSQETCSDDASTDEEGAAGPQNESVSDGIEITSEGQRSEDDDSFQAIHHYPSNQFIEPGDQLQIPRTSLSGSRSCSLDFDVPDFILVENAPEHVPRIWTQNSTYQCLSPKQWIAEDILNDMSRLLIKSLKLDESVALVNTHEFNVITTSAMSRYVSEALRCQGINSDMLIVNIRMNNHFLFAVVLYRPKIIVIVDSLKGVVSVDQIYKPLLLLVAATYFVGFVQFDPMEWRIITENEVASQQNDFDCGVYAIFNQHQMLRRLPFMEEIPSSETLRRWILHCLHTTEAKGPVLIPRRKKIKRLVHRDKVKVEDLLTSLEIPSSELICESGACHKDIRRELSVCRQSWRPCSFIDCKANVDENVYIMCTYCRDWFHLGPCIALEEAKEDYYLCLRCNNNRISL